MASEIKVDTISEKTSAGGVTIDGLLIKDGGISGDVSLIGTTPTFTIGDAGAEDAALVFDGNAKDFYIALDDSADKLVIGEGSTVGTNSILTITDDSVTIGDAAAVDTKIVFDGNAQDFYIALDDSADDLLIGLGSTVGTTPAISIDSDLKVNIPVTTASSSTSTGSLITGGGMGVGADLYIGDDAYLITDSAVLGFGADKDTTLTHTDGTGLTLNSTNKLCFNDASQFVQGSSNAILSLGATDEIDLTATAIDINGTCDVSGTLTNGSAAVKVVGTETIWVPATAMTPTVSNGCAAIVAAETTSGRPDMDVLDFDKDSDEHAQFSIAFPKSWNLGTVTFQAFWTSTGDNTDGVAWALQGVSCANNDTIDIAYGTAVVVTDNNLGAAEDVLLTAASSAVTIAGSPGDDELTYFRIFRDVSNGTDDLASDARLMGIKLFYKTDAKNDA